MRRRRRVSPRDLLIWLVIVIVSCTIIAFMAIRDRREAELRRQQYEQLQNPPDR